MSDNDDKPGIFNIKTGLFSASWSGKRVAELITILTLLVAAVLAYILWEHNNNSKENFKLGQDQFVAAMNLISGALEDNAIAQREFACLISKSQGDERERAFTTGSCRRQAEIGRRGR